MHLVIIWHDCETQGSLLQKLNGLYTCKFFDYHMLTFNLKFDIIKIQIIDSSQITAR